MFNFLWTSQSDLHHATFKLKIWCLTKLFMTVLNVLNVVLEWCYYDRTFVSIIDPWKDFLSIRMHHTNVCPSRLSFNFLKNSILYNAMEVWLVTYKLNENNLKQDLFHDLMYLLFVFMVLTFFLQNSIFFTTFKYWN